MSDERAERAAVDTTVVVSAFIGQGLPTHVIRRWQAGQFVLVVTSAIVAEYADVLTLDGDPALGSLRIVTPRQFVEGQEGAVI